MTTNIYDQHTTAFANVSAFVILKDGESVAKVAIKFPKDGAGRLWAYCHVLGCPMQRAYAGGYGYDKRSPAVRGAFAKALSQLVENCFPPSVASLREICDALAVSEGEYWDRLLERAGFTVLQAV